MSDLVVARTTSVGPGGRRIQRGTVLCAQDPVVAARPQLFVPYDLVHHCRSGRGAEQATAAPGELRNVPPPLEPAPQRDGAPRRPPTSGPGSGVPAWREYAAAVTGTPIEEWAGLGRDEIVSLLPPDEGE